jgi:rubrerythrin
MSDLNMPVREALAAAIEMEKKGQSFFSETARKADEELAKEVFTFLAAEELNHIMAIEKFNQEFLSGEKIDVENLIDDLILSRPRQTIDELFRNLSGSVPLEGTNLDAYKFAMDFERKGSEFYKKAVAEAADPGAKKLFGFLVGEEQKHFKIVESCLLYFDNPEEFFHQRERWHVEG